MADGVNKVILIGNLGADPELRMTNGGSAVMTMRLAVSESYMDRNNDRQEKTEWINVVLWGKRAEGLAKFVSKGMKVYVEGSIQTRQYDDREGNKRYVTEVKAFDVKVLTQKSDGRQRSAEREPSQQSWDNSNPPADDDDIPF